MKNLLPLVLALAFVSCNSGEPVENAAVQTSPQTVNRYVPDAATRAAYSAYSPILIYDGTVEGEIGEFNLYPIMIGIEWDQSYAKFVEAVAKANENPISMAANLSWYMEPVGQSGASCKFYADIFARNEWEAYGKAYMLGVMVSTYQTPEGEEPGQAFLTEIIVFAPES